jgi:hypothetical protein
MANSGEYEAHLDGVYEMRGARTFVSDAETGQIVELTPQERVRIYGQTKDNYYCMRGDGREVLIARDVANQGIADGKMVPVRKPRGRTVQALQEENAGLRRRLAAVHAKAFEAILDVCESDLGVAAVLWPLLVRVQRIVEATDVDHG